MEGRDVSCKDLLIWDKLTTDNEQAFLVWKQNNQKTEESQTEFLKTKQDFYFRLLLSYFSKLL